MQVCVYVDIHTHTICTHTCTLCTCVCALQCMHVRVCLQGMRVCVHARVFSPPFVSCFAVVEGLCYLLSICSTAVCIHASVSRPSLFLSSSFFTSRAPPETAPPEKIFDTHRYRHRHRHNTHLCREMRGEDKGEIFEPRKRRSARPKNMRTREA